MNYRCCSKISKGVNSGRIIRIYCRILDNICINQNRRTRKVNYCVQCTPRQVYPFSRLWLSFLVEVWLKFFFRVSRFNLVLLFCWLWRRLHLEKRARPYNALLHWRRCFKSRRRPVHRAPLVYSLNRPSSYETFGTVSQRLRAL